MKTGLDELSGVQDGGVDGRYKLASDPVDLGGGLRFAEVVDQQTARCFALWFLPPDLAADRGRVDSLQARVAASIGIGERRILKTYGMYFGGFAPAVRVEMSREPRLVDAAPAQDLRTAKLSSTVAWLHQIAEALDKAGADPGLAHGAVSPFWVRMRPDGTPRLDGISFAAWFADAGALRPEEVWFSSPARRRKEAPDVADDVFGVAALAFWALAGGGRTEQLPPNGVRLGMIENLRKSRGLPPTGGRDGWDEPIVEGLSVTPSLRPATPTSLTARLRALLPESPGKPAASSAAKAPPIRRMPPWRDLTHAGGTGNGTRVVGNGADAVGDRLGFLQRLEGEVASARQTAETDLRENALQRARLQADLAAVARSATEIDSARQKLEAADRDLIQKLDALQAKERALSEREQAAEAHSVSIGSREASVVGRETVATTKQHELEALQGQLQRKTAELERSVLDFTAAQERLGLRQQELERSEKEFAARRAQLTVELEDCDRARGKLEHEAKNLQAEQERLQQREAEAARQEAGFTAREHSVTAREQEVSRSESEFAATREKLAAERADINRLLLENKSLVDEAKNAEARIEAARLERVRIEQELAALRADLATFEQALKRREEAANQKEVALADRENANARREAMFETLGVALHTGGKPAETEKVIAELIARQRRVDEREVASTLKEKEIEQGRTKLASAVQENDRERTSIAGSQKQLERERSALAEKTQGETRKQQAWEAAKQEQESALAARAAEAEAIAAKLLLRGVVQDVLAETADPAPPPPQPLPVERPRASRLWPVTAMAAIAAVLVLGFVLFQASSDNDTLRKSVEGAAKKTVLIVTTDPLGAEVSIEGQTKKRSPATFEGLSPGRVTVSASKDGYRSEVNIVEIEAGKTVAPPPIVLGPLALASNATGALLVIKTKPSGAEVIIPGFAPRRSPTVFENLPAGGILVRVSLEKFDRSERTIQLRPDTDVQTEEFTLTRTPLSPSPGGLSVRTNPRDASVEIGGRLVPRLPGVAATVMNLPPGPVKVVVKGEGFEPWEQTIDVKSGVLFSVPEVVLKEIPPPVVEVVKVVPPVQIALPTEATIEVRSSPPIGLLRIEPQDDVAIGALTKVRITRPFFVAMSEVTQSQFAEVMGAKKNNPSKFQFEEKEGPPVTTREANMVPRQQGGTTVMVQQGWRETKIPGPKERVSFADHPVETVTWEEAMDFCRILTEREKSWLPKGAVFRLPTEAEWWAVVKANPRPNMSTWVAQEKHRAIPGRRTGERSISDLFGNVGEWCLDAWEEKPPENGTIDPLTVDPSLRRLLGGTVDGYALREVSETGGRRVIAGGSFRDRESRLRKAGGGAAEDIGFRIVLGYPVGGPKAE